MARKKTDTIDEKITETKESAAPQAEKPAEKKETAPKEAARERHAPPPGGGREE